VSGGEGEGGEARRVRALSTRVDEVVTRAPRARVRGKKGGFDRIRVPRSERDGGTRPPRRRAAGRRSPACPSFHDGASIATGRLVVPSDDP